MTDRIAALRKLSIETHPSISMERAELVTEVYESPKAGRTSAPVLRGMVFQNIMENKALYLGDGELVVGERGPAPQATPTYPEICTHTPEDLDLLNSRPKISYKVSPKDRDYHEKNILPFWRGNAQRDHLFAAMSPPWRAAYDAGIFTEFQEQRTPGHTALGDKIFKKGVLDIKEDISRTLKGIKNSDPNADSMREELRAMDIAADGIISYSRRYAELLEEKAFLETGGKRKLELETMAANCRRVPGHAPETFWQALQCYWFVHIGVITELNPWDSFNPGRLDQHLFPFYERDITSGILTEEFARELLQAFWIKFHNHPAPPKVGVTAEESGTYTDFALINLGGVKTDGSDGVNELTHLILDVIKEMRMVQPGSMVQVSSCNPDKYLRHAVEVIKTGFGQPSVFNTDLIVKELVRQGKSLEDARAGGASGCVESGAFGKEAYFLSGYFNIPKILEITLHNGVDPGTGRKIGTETGNPVEFATFDELFTAFEKQMRYFIDIKIEGNNVIEKLYADRMPVPFLSLVIDDCVEKGLDYHCGGARYNTTYIQGVGLGSITDSLASIRHNVFDHKRVSMATMINALRNNFEGAEDLRRVCLDETPKYGNDDNDADEIACRVFKAYWQAVDGRPNSRGGCHRINMLPTTVHVYFGRVTGALPDGRPAGKPFSEGISPVQGADRNGPTSVMKSAAKMDQTLTGGTLLNQKFAPQLLADEAGIAGMVGLIRGYFRMDGHHVQFNVLNTDILRRAQEEPDRYRDLIVRVAGYSDYFVNLNRDLQNEIIERTEQSGYD